MGKKMILWLVLLFEALCLFGQNAKLNHSKYWFYRYRLRNEFMAVGDGGQCGSPLGMNIPASSAYEADQDIHFGDGTSHMGNLIAVLATEYALLNKSGSLTDSSKNAIVRELYWCLKAYERLDKQAEVLFAPKVGKCTDDVNGFFCRDDVDTNIISKLGSPWRHNYLNGEVTGKKTFYNSSYRSNHNLTLPYLDNVDPNDETGEPFPSDDQISNLLVGFAFVRKIFTGTGATYKGEDLGELASYYTNKILDYYSKAGYDLIIPNSSNTVSKYGGTQSTALGYAMAKAGENIAWNHWGSSYTYGQWAGSASQVSLDVWNCMNYPVGLKVYQNNYMDGVSPMPGLLPVPSGNQYNNAIMSQFAAIGNSFEYGLVPIAREVACINIPCTAIYWDNCRNICIVGRCHNFCGPRFAAWDCGQKACAYMWHYNTQSPTCFEGAITSLASILNKWVPLGEVPFQLPKLTINTTGFALAQYGHETHTEIFSLEHRYLHGGTQYYGTNAITDYLNIAPCSGPNYYPTNDPHNDPLSGGVYTWRTDNRFEKSNPTTQLGHGGWNGIDYMLLHNLYYLLHGSASDLSGLANEMNYSINNVSYPLSTTPSGSTSSPLTVNGFETITATNTTVGTGTNVTYHAGKCVKMKQGFSVKSGSSFKAFTKYIFPCNKSTGYADGTTYPTPTGPIVDAPKDSAAFVNSINNTISTSLKKSSDSLYPIATQQKANSQLKKYVPLSTFVATANPSKESYPTSRILNVYPNPVSKPDANSIKFNMRIYLTKIDPTIKIWLSNTMGSSFEISFNSNYQLVGDAEERDFEYFSNTPFPPGIYTVHMRGSDFSSNYNIVVP